MYELGIKLAGGIYVILGLLGLRSVFGLLPFWPQIDFQVVLSWPMLMCVVSWLLAYSFFTLRRWGRYLSILVNGLLFGIGVV